MLPTKLVLDTNVYLMSLARPGSFLDTLIRKAVATGAVQLYTSAAIMQELQSVLEDKFQLSREAAVAITQVCEEASHCVRPTQRLKVPALRDENDIKILECALSAQTEIIVSADKDLLQLKNYETIKIIHPSALKYWLAHWG